MRYSGSSPPRLLPELLLPSAGGIADQRPIILVRQTL